MPKAALKHKGKYLIEHTLDLIPKECSEIIIIVGYLGEMIVQAIGNSWNSIPINYVKINKIHGTGAALWEAKEYLNGEKFLVFPADDVYSKFDIEALCSICPSILVFKIENGSQQAGKIAYDEKGKLVNIKEGLHDAPFLAFTGAYYLTSEIFNYPLVQIEGRDEYGLPQTLELYSKDHNVHFVHATSWEQIVSPEDLVN